MTGFFQIVPFAVPRKLINLRIAHIVYGIILLLVSTVFAWSSVRPVIRVHSRAASLVTPAARKYTRMDGQMDKQTHARSVVIWA